MANHEELSHYNLDFVMVTSKKVNQKVVQIWENEAWYLVSDLDLLRIYLKYCQSRNLSMEENKLPQIWSIVFGGQFKHSNSSFGGSLCALRCDLRGQIWGQIWNIWTILCKISFYKLSAPPGGIPYCCNEKICKNII